MPSNYSDHYSPCLLNTDFARALINGDVADVERHLAVEDKWAVWSSLYRVDGSKENPLCFAVFMYMYDLYARQPKECFDRHKEIVTILLKNGCPQDRPPPVYDPYGIPGFTFLSSILCFSFSIETCALMNHLVANGFSLNMPDDEIIDVLYCREGENLIRYLITIGLPRISDNVLGNAIDTYVSPEFLKLLFCHLSDEAIEGFEYSGGLQQLYGYACDINAPPEIIQVCANPPKIGGHIEHLKRQGALGKAIVDGDVEDFWRLIAVDENGDIMRSILSEDGSVTSPLCEVMVNFLAFGNDTNYRIYEQLISILLDHGVDHFTFDSSGNQISCLCMLADYEWEYYGQRIELLLGTLCFYGFDMTVRQNHLIQYILTQANTSLGNPGFFLSLVDRGLPQTKAHIFRCAAIQPAISDDFFYAVAKHTAEKSVQWLLKHYNGVEGLAQMVIQEGGRPEIAQCIRDWPHAYIECISTILPAVKPFRQPFEANMCSICYDDFEKNQKVVELRCEHGFCFDCMCSIARDFDRRCPYCRQIYM